MDREYIEGLARFKRLVAAHNWKFAKTMQWCPHFYTLRIDFKDDADFAFMYAFIQKYGKHEHWFNHPRVYLYVDEWKYWTMGNPLDITKLINRARIDAPTGEERRK